MDEAALGRDSTACCPRCPLGRARLSEPAALWWTDGSESRPYLHSRVPAIGFGCRVQMFGLGKVTGVK